MSDRLIRMEMLVGGDAIKKLKKTHVAVLGLGGVGSWCAEALARSGVGALTLVDEDTVSESNINRQLVATMSSIGKPKAEVLAARIADIAPDCEVFPKVSRYEAKTRDNFSFDSFDYIADAIDLVSCKLDLIITAQSAGVPIISALGAGNKFDAQKLEITDISKTKGCPLARVVRKELRSLGVLHHRVVYSPEEAAVPAQTEEPAPGRRSVPGSLVWVTASAGLLMAQAIITELM